MPVGAGLAVSGTLGAAASISGANKQAKATKEASKVQQQMFDTTRADLAPFRAAGVDATNQLITRLPSLTSPIVLDQAFLQQTPGYQFALRQGLKSTQSGAAARGLGKSGAAVKGAAAYTTGLADQTYGQQFDRELAQRQQAFNQLLGTSQLGGNAAAQTGNFAVQTGQNIGNNLIAGGTAQAAGGIGAANSISNALNSYMGYNLANQLLGTRGTGMYAPASTAPAGYGSLV